MGNFSIIFYGQEIFTVKAARKTEASPEERRVLFLGGNSPGKLRNSRPIHGCSLLEIMWQYTNLIDPYFVNPLNRRSI